MLEVGTYSIRASGKRGAVITIPTVCMNALEVGIGDSLDIAINKKKLVITKSPQIHPIFAGIVGTMKGGE